MQKKASQLPQVNHAVLNDLNAADVHVLIPKVAAAAVDETWSVVGTKTQQRWFWPAIDHRTGVMLADVFGSRHDEVWVQLQQLLPPVGIHHVYTDGAEVYQRH